jgi:hypothetical protein
MLAQTNSNIPPATLQKVNQLGQAGDEILPCDQTAKYTPGTGDHTMIRCSCIYKGYSESNIRLL